MPIAATSMLNLEVHVHGICAAGGSTSRLSDFSFFYQRTNPSLPLPTKTQIDTAFQTAVVVPLGAALNARWLQTRNSIRYLDDALDAFVDFSHAVAGQVTGDSMATTLSAFILAKTGLRGKSYSGKKHLFPLSESDTTAATDDILNATALGHFTAFATAWLNGFTDASGNQWKSTVYSRHLSQAKVNPTNIIASLITSVLVNKRIGEMKHRKVASLY
jgi:hypothetical protein